MNRQPSQMDLAVDVWLVTLMVLLACRLGISRRKYTVSAEMK
jgi:hypothetical protein